MDALFVARAGIADAAALIFARDLSVRSVGIGRASGAEVAYIATRNARVAVAFTAAEPVRSFHDIPILYGRCFEDPRALAAVLPEERNRHRPLACGLEVLNTLDQRCGSIGCFVHTALGEPAILTANHVIARENLGVRRAERIVQPNLAAPQQEIGLLHDFVWPTPSPYGAQYGQGSVTPNVVDAAIALIDPNIPFNPAYLPCRNLRAPTYVADAEIDDVVYKVGRTTGIRKGIVKQTNLVIPVNHRRVGMCWFHDSLQIASADEEPFASEGDSGAAVVREDGAFVGLIYGGYAGDTGHLAVACPARATLHALNCSLDPAAF